MYMIMKYLFDDWYALSSHFKKIFLESSKKFAYILKRKCFLTELCPFFCGSLHSIHCELPQTVIELATLKMLKLNQNNS